MRSKTWKRMSISKASMATMTSTARTMPPTSSRSVPTGSATMVASDCRWLVMGCDLLSGDGASLHLQRSRGDGRSGREVAGCQGNVVRAGLRVGGHHAFDLSFGLAWGDASQLD